MPSIDGDKLILLIVKPMPRQHLVRVRDRYAFESGIIENRPDSVRKILFAEEPIVIERVSSDERLVRIRRRTKMRQQSETGKSNSASFKKISTAEVLMVLHKFAVRSCLV
jgi:hypothetical protein